MEEGWYGMDGQHATDDVARIFHRADHAHELTDTSGMRRGHYNYSRPDHDVCVAPEFEPSHVVLQQALIEHFHYKLAKREVVWPTRNRVPPSTF